MYNVRLEPMGVELDARNFGVELEARTFGVER